jgi:hypothetical protein
LRWTPASTAIGSQVLRCSRLSRPRDDEGGVGPLLGAIEARQVALQEGRDPVLATADLVGRHDGVGQEGLGVRMIQERRGSPSRRISSASDHNPLRSKQ